MARSIYGGIQVQKQKRLSQHEDTSEEKVTPRFDMNPSICSREGYPRFVHGFDYVREQNIQYQPLVIANTQRPSLHVLQKMYTTSQDLLRRKTPSGVLFNGYSGILDDQLLPGSSKRRLLELPPQTGNKDWCGQTQLHPYQRQDRDREQISYTRRPILHATIANTINPIRSYWWTEEQRHWCHSLANSPMDVSDDRVTDMLRRPCSKWLTTSNQQTSDESHLNHKYRGWSAPPEVNIRNDYPNNNELPCSIRDTQVKQMDFWNNSRLEGMPEEFSASSRPSRIGLENYQQIPQCTASSEYQNYRIYESITNLSTPIHGHSFLSTEDSSRPDRVLCWAQQIYASLIHATQLTQKQEHSYNSLQKQTGSMLDVNHFVRGVQSLQQKDDNSKLHSGRFESSEWNYLPGSRQTLQVHGVANGKVHGIYEEARNPFHGSSAPSAFHQRPAQFQDVKTQRFPVSNTHTSSAAVEQASAVPRSGIFRSPFRVREDEADLKYKARHAINLLAFFCHNNNMTWLSGMLQAGCLAYALGHHHESISWFLKVLNIDQDNVETISKLAVAFMAVNQRREAEHYWRLVLKLRPSFLEAAERLAELLCSEQRRQDALQVVTQMQSTMQQIPCCEQQSPRVSQDVSVTCASPMSSITLASSELQITTKSDDELSATTPTRSSSASNRYEQKPGNCQRLPSVGVDGRLLAVVHLKGNILYSMNNLLGAANAYEEVVLMATTKYTTLLDLIECVLDRSSESAKRNSTNIVQANSDEPLLLTPKRALATANSCFPNDEHLSGIRSTHDSVFRSGAISVLSNSLLSLAKVYQDSLSCNEKPSLPSGFKYNIRHILALYYLSFSLKPSPSTANNIGILLASVQKSTFNGSDDMQAEELGPCVPGVIPGSGTWLALKYYEYGLSLDSNHAHLYTNLGSLLKEIGQLPLAIEMYQRAVTCDDRFDIALANLANAVKDQGKAQEAIMYYKRAVEVNPNFSEAICGLANVLNSICDWTARGGVVAENAAFDRWHVDDKGGLIDSRTQGSSGFGWVRHVVQVVDLQLSDIESWGRGIFDLQTSESFINQLLVHQVGLETYNEKARKLRNALGRWSGQEYEGSRAVRLVERALRQIGWRWYHDKYINGNVHTLAKYARPQLPYSLPPLAAPKVLPFHTFTLPLTAKQIRSISQRNALRTTYTTLRASWLPATVYPPPPPPSPQLNIGYVSSDFNNHPLAHLMQSVFGLHDKQRVKAICYATTFGDSSCHRQKIENEAPVFHDASGWSTEQLIRQIVNDQVHILVNLNGYTRGARNEVFAARPAPVQMSFMGYAGTLGAEWCDYILADATAIPVETLRPWRCNVDFDDLMQDENTGANNNDWVYGENIIYTRESFFCCDHRQSASVKGEDQTTWEEEQKRRWRMRNELFPSLKDSAIIFGNFNQLYKIDPTIFRTWLRILSRVPDAILWLLRFPDLGEARLRATANAWAGPSVASRIVFTDVAPKAIHIVRACVIDLFLDTPECNGHTTAADCLWSGTPLLTLPRYPWKMASRMAAGIIGGVLDRSTQEGMEAWKELVTSSEEDYEDTAVRLACEMRYLDGSEGLAEGRLMELRKLVWQGKWRRGGLFDTERWVGEVEDAYEEAWRRWVNGVGGDIRLTDL